MRLFLTGASLLALAFLVHVVLWRIFVPKRQTRALLLVFALTPAAAILAVNSFHNLPAFAELTAPDILRLTLFYIAWSLAYICIYSAIEVSSPTLTIVSYVASRGSIGCPEQEIADFLMDKDNMATRINAMVKSRLIAINDGRGQLTRKGRLTALIFELESIVFRLPLGG